MTFEAIGRIIGIKGEMCPREIHGENFLNHIYGALHVFA